jgi:UDP-2-acetamido-2,6-beta-L-arabino-hexul-4-ose reductase
MAPLTTVLVTGSDGFIGKNLREALGRRQDVRVLTLEVGDPAGALAERAVRADVIYHLAGVNRPEREEEFGRTNAGVTCELAAALEASGRRPLVVLASSTQAALDNPYGRSKRAAEEALAGLATRTGAPVRVFRLPGVFGKWCRPDYNSVVATFCHHTARGLPITISDPAREIALVYVDDVVAAFLSLVGAAADGYEVVDVAPVHHVTLGRLAGLVRAFREGRTTLHLPDLADRFTACLHATYLSYLGPLDLAWTPLARADQRGVLVELLKSPHAGQLFVSTTKPGVTRGNHYHDTKVERFCVLAGEAVIRLRHIVDGRLVTYRVSGRRIDVVDIPPGYTHSIENVGDGDMVVLFWASEVFDPARPDTFFREVLDGEA